MIDFASVIMSLMVKISVFIRARWKFVCRGVCDEGKKANEEEFFARCRLCDCDIKLQSINTTTGQSYIINISVHIKGNVIVCAKDGS